MAIASQATKASSDSTPFPVAPQVPHTIEKHGDVRQDPYFWMNKRDSKEVLEYLAQENSFYEKTMKPYEALKKQIYTEIRGRVKEDEDSVPYKKGDYYYWNRYQKGAEYPQFVRVRAAEFSAGQTAKKSKGVGRSEEVVLDIPTLAKGEKYFQVGAMSLTPDHMMLAYAVDTVGRRFYDIHFRDLKTRKNLDYKIPATTGSFTWANDGKTFFFAKQHPKTLRAYQIFRGRIGSDQFELVFEEKDETFHLSVGKSLNQQTIMIHTQSTLSTEVLLLDPNAPEKPAHVFWPREKKHEYGVTDGGDRFFIVSNYKAKNFQLLEIMKDQMSASGFYDKKKWRVVIRHSPKIYIEDIYAFDSHFVISQRQNALTELVVYERPKTGGLSKTNNENKKFAAAKLKKTAIVFKDEAYVASFGANAEYHTDKFRYEYESMSQPPTTYDYDLRKSKSAVVREKIVPNYDAKKYKTLRLFAPARDGEKIPISVLVKKNFKPKGKNPLYVYAYGSYGISMEPSFDRSTISLVDRGFAHAILHIRGGSEKGREWYENGKLLKKKNTFNDFIDATEFLVKKGYGQKGRVYAMGGSAGGLLMGAIYNMRPDLYNGIIAAVPFVDIVTTMLDDTIPLTTFEYDEWGNPNDKKFYKYMKSYSPYDNIKKKDYSNLFIATGYHDSQVQYWEPAKWAARLRTMNTNPNATIIFRTDMDAGHSGASGRFKSIEEDAMYYSFFVAMDEKALAAKK